MVRWRTSQIFYLLPVQGLTVTLNTVFHSTHRKRRADGSCPETVSAADYDQRHYRRANQSAAHTAAAGSRKCGCQAPSRSFFSRTHYSPWMTISARRSSSCKRRSPALKPAPNASAPCCRTPKMSGNVPIKIALSILPSLVASQSTCHHVFFRRTGSHRGRDTATTAVSAKS